MPSYFSASLELSGEKENVKVFKSLRGLLQILTLDMNTHDDPLYK